MHNPTYVLRHEVPTDDHWIEALHTLVFGPERHKRAAYVLRDGVPHDMALSFVAARADGDPVGTVRMTAMSIGERPALLLGPLAVKPEMARKGAGRALVRRALAAAWTEGHTVALLVGDLPYYGPLGFVHLGRDVITMPAPVDPDRVLVAALREGALAGLGGPARRAEAPATV